MAIDPNLVTTVKVGELPSEPFLGSDLIPHEVNGNLKKGTLTDLATFLATIIGASDAVGFRPVTIVDGQTLPSVTPNKNEFILVGKGTFPNVGGGSPITTTEELNALVTSGVTWAIGVEIPIDVEFAGIVQTIRDGFTETAPSENAVFDALAGKASILHATTHEVTGSDPINGENLSVNVLPPTANYIPFAPTLKGHLQGIDSALGDVVQTTAGITSRVFFTGDLITLGANTFYLSNYGGKGTVAGASPTPVINDDNQLKFFTQDIISIPFDVPIVAPAGAYSGNLSVRINNDNAQQKYYIEVYRTALDGTPLASGVAGASVGTLGVTVLSILDSGLLNLVGGDISSINLTGYLTQEITFNVNERLRYRVLAEKVGTTGGNITMEVFYGSNYNSFYDVPVIADTNSVLNRSTVVGTTTTNALDSLNSLKANISQLHNPVTIGTANGLSLAGQVLSLGLSSSTTTGALPSTDWNTFNGKANANGSNASGTWGISISGNATTASTATTSNSVNNQSYTDANQQTGVGFRAFTSSGASTNFPFPAGAGIEIKRSGPSLSSVGSFQLWATNNQNVDGLYFRKVTAFSTSEVWTPWVRLAELNGAGRFLLGTTTDNLTDIAQFNGSAIATAWKVQGGTTSQYQTGTGTVVDFGTSVRGTALTGFTSGAGTVSATDNVLQAINKLDGNDALKANLASPTLTGTPTAPTATAGTNTTQIATTAFVTGAVTSASTLQGVYDNSTPARMTINATKGAFVIKNGETLGTQKVLTVTTQADVETLEVRGNGYIDMKSAASAIALSASSSYTAASSPTILNKSNKFTIYGSTTTSNQGGIVLDGSNLTTGTLVNFAFPNQSGTIALTSNPSPISATQFNVSALNTAPASATATGTTGEIRITSTHIYVCIATNTWVRTALTTW